MFKNSICEYKNRGNYGNSNYPGNTSGKLIADFLGFAHRNKKGLFADPMAGGYTSRDIAKELGLKYKGLDLKQGFDIVNDDLGHELGEAAESIFCHAPYWQLIKYSNDARDLSNAKTLDDFLSKMQLAMMNVYEALRPGARYGVLMGNWRKNGNYYPLCSLMPSICPGKLKEEIIKIQNNCTSDKNIYSGAGKTFIPIKHEVLYIFEKSYSTILNYAVDLSNFLYNLHKSTWLNVVKAVFRRNKKMTLAEVYQSTKLAAGDKIKYNLNWKAKVRQILQNENVFIRVNRGVYCLK